MVAQNYKFIQRVSDLEDLAVISVFSWTMTIRGKPVFDQLKVNAAAAAAVPMLSDQVATPMIITTIVVGGNSWVTLSSEIIVQLFTSYHSSSHLG